MLYRFVKVTHDITTPDDTVAGNRSWHWPKNRICNILGIYYSIPLHSTHYPFLQVKDDVLTVGANMAWTQRQKSVVNRTRLWVQSGGYSVNIDWSRILLEFARLLKELRIGKEEEICSIYKSSKFMLCCNCTSEPDHLTQLLLLLLFILNFYTTTSKQKVLRCSSSKLELDRE